MTENIFQLLDANKIKWKNEKCVNDLPRYKISHFRNKFSWL